MKRHIGSSIAWALVTILVFSGTVWAAGEQLVTADRIGNPNAKTTLTFWQHAAFGIGTPNPKYAAVIRARMEAWAKKNPDVKLRIESELPWGKIHEVMLKLLESTKVGQQPDLATLDSFWVPRFLKTVPDALQPLDEFMTDADRNDFYPAYRKFVSDDKGRVRALFWNTDVRPLWYRTDLISKPPKNWKEVIEIGQKVMKDNKEVTDGFLTEAGLYENTTFNYWGTYWAAGGELVDAKGRPVFNQGKNREAMLKVLRLLRQLVDSKVMSPRVVEMGSSAALDAAVAGSNPAMFLGGTWRLASLRDLLGPKLDKWDITPTPPVFEGDAPTTGAGGWTWGIFTKDAAKQKLAFSFLWDVYGSFEGMGEVCFNAGWLPTRKSVAEQYGPMKSDKLYAKFTDQLKYARLRPAAPVYPDISRVFQTEFAEVILGRKAPEKALDDAYEKVMEVYRE